MLVLGVDAHKRSHTIVAVDSNGVQQASITIGTTTGAHLDGLQWARACGGPRLWAVEDCRHLSRRLERDLLVAGERIVRVPPKLMANVRSSARTFGKSDPIDALAIARAVLREPGLPVARLEGRARDVRLLADHRESLVAERTRVVNRLRWRVHELDPEIDPRPGSLDRTSNLAKLALRLDPFDGLVARLARSDLERCQQLTVEINAVTAEVTVMVTDLAPALLCVVGCGPVLAAKIVGETASVERFKSADAYARYNGTAPVPVWSANQHRHRLSRSGNRQLNYALHMIAVSQLRWHQPAKELFARRKATGNSNPEALRVLKRHLSNTVYQALLDDSQQARQRAA